MTALLASKAERKARMRSPRFWKRLAASTVWGHWLGAVVIAQVFTAAALLKFVIHPIHHDVEGAPLVQTIFRTIALADNIIIPSAAVMVFSTIIYTPVIVILSIILGSNMCVALLLGAVLGTVAGSTIFLPILMQSLGIPGAVVGGALAGAAFAYPIWLACIAPNWYGGEIPAITMPSHPVAVACCGIFAAVLLLSLGSEFWHWR